MPVAPVAARSRANASTPYFSIGFQYVISTTGTPADATASMIRSVSRVRTPPASAMSLAFWITGPSITGSEYGSSTSITSHPASAIATIEAMLPSTVGNPAGMQPTRTARPSARALPNTSLMLTGSLLLPRHDRLLLVEDAEVGARGVHILVAAAGQVHHDRRRPAQLGGQPGRDPRGAGEGVRALDGRDDPFGTAEQLERRHRLRVGDRFVAGPAGVVQPRVLGTDAGVVQSGRDRVRLDGLPVVVLKHVRPGPVQDPGRAAGDRRRVPPGLDPVAAGLEAVEPNPLVG